MIHILSKKIITHLAAIALATGAFFGANQIVSAQTSGNESLVQMIAQKFNLNQSNVQAVFDQYKTQHQANLQAKYKTYLDGLVSQGKITTAQEQAIFDEESKLKSEFNPQALKSMTLQQRRDAFQKRRNELESWAKSQGIDLSLLRPRTGMGRHMGWFGKITVSPTP